MTDAVPVSDAGEPKGKGWRRRYERERKARHEAEEIADRVTRELYQTVQDLERAKQEAERANRAKSEFLSRMSHELRTPLNAILGFGQLLATGPLDAEGRDSVQYVLKAGRQLLELIDDVLDLSRIEAGRLRLSVEPVAVSEVVQGALDLTRPMAEARGVRLDPSGPEETGRHVQADRQRLRQVLLNLLSNAIKYNRHGGTVRIEGFSAGADRYRLTVRDTGHGIPPERMHELFVPFSRLGAEATGVEGTGLGLALSRTLVEAMGGAIGGQSTPGTGSTFWVELPLAQGPADRADDLGDAPVAPAAAAVSGTVLYIEDNLSNLTLVELVLRRRPGVTLLPAMQGELGLDLAREHRPDLILLDLHLPDVGGDEVLLRLRGDPRTAAIPVIMLSAEAMPGEVDRLLAAGAHAYLTKPFEIERLLGVLDELLGHDRSGRGVGS